MSVRWLRRAIWVVAFGALWLPVCDDPPLRSEAYLLDVTTDGAAIGLITAVPQRVEAVVRDGGGKVVAKLGEHEARRRHSFVVTGLPAGTTLDYELLAANGETWRGRIHTAPTDDRAPVRFAFLGDSGDQPWWVWLQTSPALYWPARWGWFGGAAAVTAVGAGVAADHPDFVLHLGDVIYPKGLNAHYRSGFFLPFGAVLREAPFYALLGNHDVMDDAGVQCLANLRAASPAYRGDGRNFSFARGPVRVIGLDCNTDYTGGHYDATHPAARFLAVELAKSTEPWIVVASHFPMLSWSRQDKRGDLLAAMLPELTAHAVSLYLSGHDHCYQRFDANDGSPPLVVSGGGGKDLYEIVKARLGPRPVVAAKVHHWGLAETRGRDLVVRVTDIDGKQVDQFVVPAPAGPALDRLGTENPGRAARIRQLAQ